MDDYKHKGLGCIVLIVVFGILAEIYSLSIIDDIEENGRYTIGKTTKIIKHPSRGINYSYMVQGEFYLWTAKYNNKIKVPDGKYLVKFSYKNPDMSKLLPEYQLPDTLDSSYVPARGWDSIPSFIIKYNKNK